jgi:hypothetical protein
VQRSRLVGESAALVKGAQLLPPKPGACLQEQRAAVLHPLGSLPPAGVQLLQQLGAQALQLTLPAGAGGPRQRRSQQGEPAHT